MQPTTINFVPTPRFRRAQLMNDFVPGLFLFLSGIDSLTQPAQQAGFAWISIIAGAGASAVVIREWRNNSTHEGVIIRWIDIAVGIVLFVEALNRYKPWKGFQPAYLYVLVGIVTIARGVFHSKLPKRRKIVSDENGFVSHTSFFNTVKLRWDEITSIRMADTMIEFSAGNRHERINLSKIQNRDEIKAMLTDYASQRNIQLLTTD